MDNAVRGYSWGSTRQLSAFLGQRPTGKPQAELWIGAHEADPSGLPDGRRLNAVIAQDARTMLGGRVCDRFGERLPFLMKVLAVNEPLSLQVHPSAERARVGHARESRSGIAVDAPGRSYKDPWHKPELVYALTRFESMAGFRAVDASADLLGLLNLAWADEVALRLESGPASQTLRAIVTETLRLKGRTLSRLLRDVADATRHADQSQINPEADRVFANVGRLVGTYPSDPGVLVTLLLNNVTLAPGESMFVSPGVIHAHVSGLGVEIMASSDNVLRAGLTPKHLDVEELLEVTDFTPVLPPRWQPVERSADFVHLEPPVSEFSLTVGGSPLRRTPATGPRAVLVLDGTVTIETRSERLEVHRGQSVFVSHTDGPLDIQGDGTVAIGSVPAS